MSKVKHHSYPCARSCMCTSLMRCGGCCVCLGYCYVDADIEQELQFYEASRHDSEPYAGPDIDPPDPDFEYDDSPEDLPFAVIVTSGLKPVSFGTVTPNSGSGFKSLGAGKLGTGKITFTLTTHQMTALMKVAQQSAKDAHDAMIALSRYITPPPECDHEDKPEDSRAAALKNIRARRNHGPRQANSFSRDGRKRY